MKILLAEDEKDLSKALCVILKKHNYAVDAVFDGEEATSFLDTYQYDLVILDIMMPKKDGISVLKDLRSSGNKTPVLMLTAKSDIEDKVKGLDSGADDYLSKPFNIEELLARIRALLRRKDIDLVDVTTFSNITLDASTSTVSTEFGSEYLLNKEYQILELLLKTPAAIVTNEKLIDNIWSAEDYSTVNNLWVFVSYLRKKLVNIKANVTIKNHRNIGYSLEQNEEA